MSRLRQGGDGPFPALRRAAAAVVAVAAGVSADVVKLDMGTDSSPLGPGFERVTAEQVWGRERLGTETRRALEEKRGDAEFKFLQVIRPRAMREPGLRDAANMPWEYMAIDVGSAHIIEESGFEEWPFATPRWDTESGETYGRSPGMLALPDSRTLQQQDHVA